MDLISAKHRKVITNNISQIAMFLYESLSINLKNFLFNKITNIAVDNRIKKRIIPNDLLVGIIARYPKVHIVKAKISNPIIFAETMPLSKVWFNNSDDSSIPMMPNSSNIKSQSKISIIVTETIVLLNNCL